MKKKFTLIELIIVIVVIGILAAMALPKVTSIVKDARISAMINDKETLEKTILLYYQKYDELPLLNEDQEFIVLNDNISLTRLVNAKEVDDMTTIYTSLQETLKHYNDSEESLYRIDISKVKENLSRGLKYGHKKTEKDFFVYSTKTNNIYYYDIIMNGERKIQHNEFDTTLKESELVDKKFSYNLNEDGVIINSKPVVELTTDLSNITNESVINWAYNFIDEDKTPTKISFILNDIEYDSFDNIPTKLDEGEYTIKLKMQDSKGLWSNEVNKIFNVNKNVPDLLKIDTIATGYDFTLKIGKDGNLYTLGGNSYGQLGTGSSVAIGKSQVVSLPNGEKPTSVYANEYTSMAITNKGNLYAWGRNAYGQLGIGNTIDQQTPQKVIFPNGESVVYASIGRNHSAAITDAGKLYTWGRNDYSQLGLRTTETETTPQFVEFKYSTSKQIIDVALGEYHSVAVTSDGELFA